MSDSLAGRVAIITGASGGLGREYARLFASEGARLVLTDKDTAEPTTDPLSVLADELCRAGTPVVIYRGDIGTDESAEALVEAALEHYGKLDVLVNNAGNWHDSPIETTPSADWDAIMHVHLRGHFLTLRTAAQQWIRQYNQGQPVAASVINTTSRSALNSVVGHSAYAAAKGGIIALTHVAAHELAPYGIRVNCVAPAARTGMTLGIKALTTAVQAPTDAHSFDEWDPANVAPLVAYLAGTDCPLTNEILFARGGTIQRYEPWQPGHLIEKTGRWTVAELTKLVPGLVAEHGRDER